MLLTTVIQNQIQTSLAFLGNLSVIMISTTLYIYIDQVFNEVPAFLMDWHYKIALLPIVFWVSVLMILGAYDSRGDV